MGKKILHSVIFFAGLAIILVVTSKLLAPKGEVYNASEYDRKVKELSEEANDTIDVVFIGDSEVYASFDPLYMYNEDGFTSYILGTYGQRLCDTYALLEEMFKTQSPKLVAVETNCFFRFGGLADETSDEFLNLVLKYVPAMKYHSLLKMIFLNSGSKTEKMMKGFVYKTETQEYLGGQWMIPTEEVETINPVNVDYINKIIELVRKNGAEPIFVSAPSPICQNQKQHNAIDLLAKENNVAYYDFNYVAEEIGIDWHKDTKDAGNHLNYKGSCKMSAYLSKLLSEKYELTDRRNDEKYASWQEAYREYIQYVNSNK